MWGEERKVMEKKATFIEHILSYSCLVAQSCLTLCNPMNYNMPGFPFLHYLPEFAQTHVHWVNDPIQPSYPWSSPSPDLNFSSIRVFSNERKNKTNKKPTFIEHILSIVWQNAWIFQLHLTETLKWTSWPTWY